MTIYTNNMLDVLLSQFGTRYSNCCFLSRIQVSQEANQVVWRSHLFKRIFHSLLWSTQSKALAWSVKQKWLFFWNSLAFSIIQQMLAIWSPVPLSFLNPAWISGSSRFTYCWRLAWRILGMTFPGCEMSAIVMKFDHSLASTFFGIGIKTDLFQSVTTAVFSKFAGILSAALS